MPIYSYRCRQCGAEHEALQKISDAPLTDCPQCGQAELVKQVTAASFQLKGTGWYATDFKNSGKPKSAEVKSAANDTSESKTPSASSDAAGVSSSTTSAAVSGE